MAPVTPPGGQPVHIETAADDPLLAPTLCSSHGSTGSPCPEIERHQQKPDTSKIIVTNVGGLPLETSASRFGEAADLISTGANVPLSPEAQEILDQKVVFDDTIWTVSSGLGFYPPSSMAAIGGLSQDDPLDGSRWGFGANLIWPGFDPALQASIGSARAGVRVDRGGLLDRELQVSPTVGFGNLSYNFRGNLGIGYWSTNGGLHLAPPSVLIPLIILNAANKLMGAQIEHPGQILPIVASDLLPRLIPINTLREFYQFLVFAFSVPKADDTNNLDTAGKLKQALSFMESYKRQELIYVALSTLDEYLKATPDPFIRAQLMDLRDLFLFNMNRVYVPLTASRRYDGVVRAPTSLMEEYQTEAVGRARDFQHKYQSWLMTGDGEAPSEEELHVYQGDILYLTQKLPFRYQFKKENGVSVYEITESTPFAIKDPQTALEYLEVISLHYNTGMQESSGFMQFVSNQVTLLAGVLFEKSVHPEEASNEEVLEAKAKLDGLLHWLGQIRQVAGHFQMRKKHLLWMMAQEDGGSPLLQFKRADHLKGPDAQKMEKNLARMLDVNRLSFLAAVYFHTPFGAAFTGLEVAGVVRQQPYSEGLPVIEALQRGLDFLGLIEDRVPILDCFAGVYEQYKLFVHLEETDWPVEGELKKVLGALWKRARESVLQIARERSAQLYWEQSRFQGDLHELKKDLVDQADDIADAIEDISEDGEATQNLADFCRDYIQPDEPYSELAASCLEILDHYRQLTKDLGGYGPKIVLLSENHSLIDLRQRIREPVRFLMQVEQGDNEAVETHVTPLMIRVSRLSAAISALKARLQAKGGANDPGVRLWMEKIEPVFRLVSTLEAELKKYVDLYQRFNRLRAGGYAYLFLREKWGLNPQPADYNF